MAYSSLGKVCLILKEGNSLSTDFSTGLFMRKTLNLHAQDPDF